MRTKIEIINLTPNRGVQNVPIRRRGEPKRKQIVSRKQLVYWCFIIALLLVTIAFAWASQPVISNSICTTDKCFARVERLKQCQTEGASSLIECATSKTLAIAELTIYNEIESLYYLSIEPASPWKENTISLLEETEGFSATAYCDTLVYTADGRYVKACKTGRERYSIGFGTKSYPNEVITREEARKRTYNYLQTVAFPEVEHLSCYNDNQKTAIADFIYNSWKYTKHIKTWLFFIHYVKNCDKEQIEGYLNPIYYQSKGMKKRRARQYDLFTK